MSYITGEMVQRALAGMQEFHSSQISLHDRFDMDFMDNPCRRNIIMSAAQESFFAREIGRVLEGVVADGRTGQADIYIGQLDRELECKMTSPIGDRGAIQLQTDHETLVNKGKLDYLYVIASSKFDEFCVLFFEGLAPDDFRKPSANARGKVPMIKSKGMQKCTVLWGRVETHIDRARNRLEEEISNCEMRLGEELVEIEKRLTKLEDALERDADPETGVPLRAKRRGALRKMRARLLTRPDRICRQTEEKIQKIRESLEKTLEWTPRYSFILHPS